MKALKFYLSVFTLSLVLSFAGSDVQAQCAMCRSTVESNRADDKLSKFGSGLNKGILYLMAIPYVLAGTVGFFWYRSTRKSNAQ
jgi:hypothetical protein